MSYVALVAYMALALIYNIYGIKGFSWWDTLKDIVNSGELSGPPTRLRSYPFKFQEIIERAKQLAQCGAITTPFPNRADFVDEKSVIYIAEAIAEREEKGVVIPPGKCDVTMLNKLLANISKPRKIP